LGKTLRLKQTESPQGVRRTLAITAHSANDYRDGQRG